MFKSLTNINTVFRQMKFFMILIICLSFGFCAYVWWTSNELVKKSRQKIYILDQGKSLMLALSQDINQNREAEIRDHLNRFHELFFTLSPDQNEINKNIRRAFFLVDKSAEIQYKSLLDNNFYKQIIENKMYQSIEAEKIEINTNTYPYSGKYFAKTSILGPSVIIYRDLVTECQFRNVPRTDNNPHGLLIENWKVLKNSDIKTEYKRNLSE